MTIDWDAIKQNPIQLELPNLYCQYWSVSGLSKLGISIGIAVMTGRSGKIKSLQYARILLEVDNIEPLPIEVLFENEMGLSFMKWPSVSGNWLNAAIAGRMDDSVDEC